MPGSPQSDDQNLSDRFVNAASSGLENSARTGNSVDRSNSRANLEEHELEAALQLLVERAQYITGATGTALALPHGDEMVCRASAGACAPTVGARLQVRSGLTGESIARRQLLRCDNAESDPRVNLETCRALGIASIVVLPLLRRTGEVRGLFELFSDHPYAFEERDLVALERMAALTLAALDLAEQQHDSVAPATPPVKQTNVAGQVANPALRTTYSSKVASTEPPRSSDVHAEVNADTRISPVHPKAMDGPALSEPAETAPTEPGATGASSKLERSAAIEGVQRGAVPVVSATAISAPVLAAPIVSAPVISQQISAVPISSAAVVSSPVVEALPPEPAPVPEAMLRVRKCAMCGFPISEGRTVCLDCESLERVKIESEKKAREKRAREVHEIEPTKNSAAPKAAETKSEESKQEEKDSQSESKEDVSAAASATAEDEILPAFLTNPQLVEEPWLARHVNLLVFLVLVAAVLVAAVAFFR
jgi:uncharacterized Zn finger protein (UPF0148 family)/putative methionine-R-sulfoxide reductase with GAF domain